MITLYCIRPDGLRTALAVVPGLSLMQTAVNDNVPGILGECGGARQCATCHVYIASPWRERLPAPDGDEDVMLDGTVVPRLPTSRLACQIRIDEACDGLEFHVPERQI